MSSEQPVPYPEDRDTLRPEDLEHSGVVNQAQLARSLLDDPDPRVRLIAHLAQRQLDMFEMLIEMRNDLYELKEKVNGRREPEEM